MDDDGAQFSVVSTAMEVHVFIAHRRWRVPSRQAMDALVRRTLRMTGRSGAHGALSIAFVGDAAMRRLNRTLRGINRPTDVLSFSYRSSASEVEGEIVMSVPTARRHAAAIGHSIVHELSFLLVHGLLHIIGYDHERSARDERRMNDLQRRILRRTATT